MTFSVATFRSHGLPYKLLIYGFPIYMIATELLYRELTNVDTTGYIGPALATAGLGFLIPLTKPKELKLQDEDLYSLSSKLGVSADSIRTLIGRMDRLGYSFRPDNDEVLRGYVWLSVFLGFGVWMWACTVSTRFPDAEWWIVKQHMWIGAINYVIGVVFCSLKDKV